MGTSLHIRYSLLIRFSRLVLISANLLLIITDSVLPTINFRKLPLQLLTIPVRLLLESFLGVRLEVVQLTNTIIALLDVTPGVQSHRRSGKTLIRSTPLLVVVAAQLGQRTI